MGTKNFIIGFDVKHQAGVKHQTADVCYQRLTDDIDKTDLEDALSVMLIYDMVFSKQIWQFTCLKI